MKKPIAPILVAVLLALTATSAMADPQFGQLVGVIFQVAGAATGNAALVAWGQGLMVVSAAKFGRAAADRLRRRKAAAGAGKPSQAAAASAGE